LEGDVEKELGGMVGEGKREERALSASKSLCGFEKKQQPKIDRRGKGKRAKRVKQQRQRRRTSNRR